MLHSMDLFLTLSTQYYVLEPISAAPSATQNARRLFYQNGASHDVQMRSSRNTQQVQNLNSNMNKSASGLSLEM